MLRFARREASLLRLRWQSSFAVFLLWLLNARPCLAVVEGSHSALRRQALLPRRLLPLELDVNASVSRRKALVDLQAASEPERIHVHEHDDNRSKKVGHILLISILAVVALLMLLGGVAGCMWASRDYSDLNWTIGNTESCNDSRFTMHMGAAHEDFADEAPRTGDPSLPDDEAQPPQSEATEGEQKRSARDKELMRCFVKLAQTGELDIYTCMGLCSGEEAGHGPRTKAYLPVIFMLFVMQAVLPSLLALYVGRTFRFYAMEQDILFRLIGLILYSFSVLHLYNSALDDCRTMFLQISLHHNVPITYLLPMLFGEFLNALTSLCLTITLFVIFCACHSAHHLLIHCVAINFVLSIDNEWTSEEMRENALVDFDRFKSKLVDIDRRTRGWNYRGLEITVKYVCRFLRVGGTLILGSCLGILFLVSNQQEMCSHLRPYEPWPICIRNPTAGLQDLG